MPSTAMTPQFSHDDLQQQNEAALRAANAAESPLPPPTLRSARPATKTLLPLGPPHGFNISDGSATAAAAVDPGRLPGVPRIVAVLARGMNEDLTWTALGNWTASQMPVLLYQAADMDKDSGTLSLPLPVVSTDGTSISTPNSAGEGGEGAGWRAVTPYAAALRSRAVLPAGADAHEDQAPAVLVPSISPKLPLHLVQNQGAEAMPYLQVGRCEAATAAGCRSRLLPTSSCWLLSVL